MVGDFAIFLVQNDLLVLRGDLAASTAATRQKVLVEARRLDFPQSVVQYFRGELGQPPGGFPDDLRAAVLKGLPVVVGRPSDGLAPFDFDAATAQLAERLGREPARREVVSHALYARVMDEFFAFQTRCGDVSLLPTPVYFYGLDIGQEVWIELEPGKTLVVQLDAKGEPDADGNVTVYFRLNGQHRQVVVVDRALAKDTEQFRRADVAAPGQVGAPMPGRVIALHVREGQAVAAGEPLLTREARKMETIVRAPIDGEVRELCTDVKAAVKAQELLVVLGAAG
jgi:pyruvate carboxylase